MTDANGSVIALADANGNELADFRYDSFGNILQSSGQADSTVNPVGGDFRFHSTWFDSATGLYSMGARVYHPETGRFLTRDAALPDMLQPESIHPYMFAVNNPRLFRDPSGYFTIIGLAVSLDMQSIMRSSKQVAVQQAKEEIKDRVQEAAIDILVDTTFSLFPVDLGKVFKSGNPGTFFEKQVKGLACQYVVPSDWWWFSPRIGIDGQGQSNGVNCAGELTTPPGTAAGFLVAYAQPDIKFDPVEPRDNAQRTGWFTGDIKLSTKTLVNDYVDPAAKENQFKAITEHAKDHQIIPFALFVSLFRGGKGGSQLEVLSLTLIMENNYADK